MADFTYEIDPSRVAEAQALVDAVFAKGGTEDDVARHLKRWGAKPATLPSAPAMPNAEDVIGHLTRRRQLADLVTEYAGKIDRPVPNPAEAEAVEPGSLSGMQPTVDPMDMAVAGGLGGGASAALRTGASEAMASKVAEGAGAAGLPPWAQSALGLAAGFLPMPSLGSRPTTVVGKPRVSRPPISPDALIPEVMGAEQRLPSMRMARPGPAGFYARGPSVIPQPYMPRSETMLPPPGPRLAESRGLPAPGRNVMAVSPTGEVALPRAPEPMIPVVKREFEQGLLGQPRPMPKQFGFPQPGGEPKNLDTRWETTLPELPDEQAGRVEEAFRALAPDVEKAAGVEGGRAARQAYENVGRVAEGPEAFNPMTLRDQPTYQKYQQLVEQIRKYGPEQFPSREKLGASDFAERLERQRQDDWKVAKQTFGPRSVVTEKKVAVRAGQHAASQIGKGDSVLTPLGPGTVIGHVESSPTSQQIRQKVEWSEPGAGRARAGNYDNPEEGARFAMSRPRSVKVKLDDGREGAWSAWNVVRVGQEEQLAGAVRPVAPEQRARIAKLRPRQQPEERGFKESRAERDYYAKKEADEAPARPSIDEVMRARDERRAAIQEHADAYVKNGRPIEFESRDAERPKVYLLSREPTDATKHRVTWFDQEGPGGHTVYDSMEAAMRDLAADSTGNVIPGTINEWSQSPRWNEGVEKTQAVQRANGQQRKTKKPKPPPDDDVPF